MPSTTSVHPNTVLETLVAKATRSNVKRTLNALHDLCRKHHLAGMRDFSVACIGRKAQETGIISYRSLYNQAAQIYRDLLQAWEAYSGPDRVLPIKTLPNYDYLMKIQDPAVRILVQQAIAERDSLKAQLNLLKGATLGTIDLRPLGANILTDPENGPKGALTLAGQLTDRERAALRAAISPINLQHEGWAEGAQGEIKVERTERVLFERGFTTAVRKILGERPDLGPEDIS